MDFSQSKLTKMEWESIEIPVSDQEKTVLKLIQDGFENLNIRQNSHTSMLSYMKIEYAPEIEMYLYSKYFDNEIQQILQPRKKKETSKDKDKDKSLGIDQMFAKFRPDMPKTSKFKPPKKIDLLRLQNMDQNIQAGSFDKNKIVEFVQLDFCHKIIYKTKPQDLAFYVYTLFAMKRATFPGLNRFVQAFIDQLLNYIQKEYPETLMKQAFHYAYHILEKNPYLLKYEDMTLYDHQKQLFQHFRGAEGAEPSFVLYTAPTGTGKTMSPLGLSNGSYKIIYICAARHIALSLARSAISMNKRVAFAFGCDTAADIRLHYYAAVDYTKNKKTGGIYKVDNANGSKVDIMICNVYSYLTAMHYMLAFHQEQEIIMYWDEPTISLDVSTHELHDQIARNWRENKISKVVFACATLPEDQELTEVFEDYRSKFGGSIRRITSADCKKTISLQNSQGAKILPHTIFSNYQEVKKSVEHFKKQPSLLRYLDIQEMVRFMEHVLPLLGQGESAVDAVDSTHLLLTNYFPTLTDFSMNSLKMYYLDVLLAIPENLYSSIHSYWISNTNATTSASHIHKIYSTDHVIGGASGAQGAPLHKTVSLAAAPKESPFKGILLTTEDAHTLTDGPTIYIVEDVQKMAKFYIQQSKIPPSVLEDILAKIESNNTIQQKMEIMTKQLDDMLGKELEKDRKVENERFNPEAKRLKDAIEGLRLELQSPALGAKYVPNTRQHQSIWLPGGKGGQGQPPEFVEDAFIPMVDETAILKIMELPVENSMKLLLLLGIGVFEAATTNSETPGMVAYMEVMKRLAYDQKLFLIIASSDYIYGTNYQLCHGFLGKDLENMTQQKIIQAMGRIGRNKIQQTYTIRFRDESVVRRLFLPAVDGNIEATNMCRLFQESGTN